MIIKKLNYQQSFIVYPTEPFHFDGTFYQPSHFPSALEFWRPGEYYHSLWFNHHLYGVKVVDQGQSNQAVVKFTIFSENKISKIELIAIKQELIWRADLLTDLKEFDRLMSKDKKFAPIFSAWRGKRQGYTDDLYSSLIVSILLQNTVISRTVTMLKILLQKYGYELNFAGQKIQAIWRPEELKLVSEEDLRESKLGYRAKFIKHLSTDFIVNNIDEIKLRELPAIDLVKELKKIYSIGPETARILAFGSFHHYGALITVAPWQAKIYSRLFYQRKKISPEKIKNDLIKRYGQYAMLAVHYIWEDIFWQRRFKHIDWLEKEIRL